MIQNLASRKLGQIIYFGTPFISLFILTGVVTDPVNLTKLTALVTLSFPILALLASRLRKSFVSENKQLIIVAIVFVFAALVSTFTSASPLSQNIYGVYGRSTGFLAYFSLVVFFLGASSLHDARFHRNLVAAFLLTGLVNVIYCAWVLAFGDFIGWSNPYGEILGLFGNPNFIGSFLGMFLVGSIALLLQPDLHIKWKIFGISVVCVTFFEIVKSKAVQGIVVSIGGVAIVSLLYLLAKKIKLIWIGVYSAVLLILATLSVFGALQRGPFTFIYKRSVSLRGTYWESGLEMGLQNPFSGVGMDGYGDWYRRARPERALIDTPGVGTVTNAAHNVVLDIFAYGGFPLLVSYVIILSIGGLALFRIARRRKSYDAVFVAMAAVWICYHVQSIISINQIGLAIWGWVLTGALVSYERISGSTDNSRKNEFSERHTRVLEIRDKEENISSGLIVGIAILMGLIIALPPVTADNKWWSALQSGNINKIDEALSTSYFNPSNSQKFAQAVKLMVDNNLPDLALKYAKASVAFNPEDFTAWYQLYNLPNSTLEDKAIAIANLKRLDPRNPEFTML